MTKIDKRKYSLKYFNEKIKTNLFLQKFIKLRDSYYNKIKLNSDCIISFKKINNESILDVFL